MTELDPRTFCLDKLRHHAASDRTLDQIVGDWWGGAGPAHGDQPAYHYGVGPARLFYRLGDREMRQEVKRGEIGALFMYPDRPSRVGVYKIADLIAELRSGHAQASLFAALGGV